MQWNKPTLIAPTSPLFAWIILFNITLATALAVISSVSAAIANSSISGPLMINQTESVWLSIGYLATVGMSLPLSSLMGRRYGSKFTFFLGFAIFVFASLCASFSPNFSVMLFFRLLEGAGGGLIFPISLTILQKTFPKEQLSLALSCYVGCGFGFGIIAGLIGGGYIGQYMAWQWIYLLNVVLGIPCLIAIFLFHQESPKDPKAPPFDIWGYLAFVAFLSSILMVVTNAKEVWNTLGWGSFFIRTFMAIGVISFILLIIREMRCDHPVIILRLFKQRHFSVGCGALLIVGALLFGTVTTLPSIFERQLGYEKWQIGLILSVFGAVLGPVGALVGYMTRFVNIRILAVIGLSFLMASCFVQERIITIQSEHWQWILVIALRAMGVAFSLGPLTSLALIEVAAEDIPCASMLVTFCRQMGGAIGGSLITLIAVYREEYHSQIYSSNVDIYSPAFQNFTEAFSRRFTSVMGFAEGHAENVARLVATKNLQAQSYISAINDSFFIMGWILFGVTIVVTAIIVWVLTERKKDVPRNS